MPSTIDFLFEKARAGYPIVYLVSPEYLRSQRDVQETATKLGREFYIWTLGLGLKKDGSTSSKKAIDGSESPLDVLKVIPALKDGCLVILQLYHHYLESDAIQAQIIELISHLKMSKKMIIILTPVAKLPPELEKEFAIVEAPLPTREELGATLDGIVAISKLSADKIPSPELRKELLEAATGLTASEAENVLSLAILRPAILKKQGHTINHIWDPRVVIEEKCTALKKTGLLEYIHNEGIGMQQVGGMKALKQWVSRRKRAFTDEARAFGLPAPKGMLMVGPPGSGKSLGSKAVSAELGLPLLRCDMGKMFGSLVGQSEANLRMAISVAEAMAPCVFWIDEIEKGLAGTSSGGSLDSGVGARLLGYLLTWMSEKKSAVFVYATANDVTSLPPELLRKGRFDEMFSVLLPNDEERKEIIEIHMKKRGRERLIGPGELEIRLPHFVKETKGFSGAEIEAAIVESLFIAFDERREMNSFDLQQAIDGTIPLSTTMKDKLQKLEDWCKSRTRAANGEENATIKDMLPIGRRVEA